MEQIIRLQPLTGSGFFRSHNVLLVCLVFLSFLCGMGFWFFSPLLVFAVASLMILGFLMIYYPYLGILVYLAVEYARIPAMFPALQALQMGKIVVIVTGLIWLLRSVLTRKLRFISDPVNWIMLFWAFVVIASSYFAGDSKLATQGAIDFLKWVIIYFLIINLVDTLPKWQWFMWILLLLNFKLSQFQIRQFMAGYEMAPSPELFVSQGVGAGSTGFFGNAGDFGVAMCIVAPLAFYLIETVRSRFLKIGAGLFFLAFAFSILRCGSRGAALALFVMGLFFWLRTSKKSQTGILILLFVIGFWGLAPQAWKERFISGADYQQDTTASQRLRLWGAGARMLSDRPLLGVGINNFNTNYAADYHAPGEAGIPWSPHNIFVQAGAELGLLGLFCLLAILFLAFTRNRETRMLYLEHKLKNRWFPNFAHALDLSLIGYIVSGSFLTVLYYPHLYIILTLTISLNQAARKQVLARGGSIKDDET